MRGLEEESATRVPPRFYRNPPGISNFEVVPRVCSVDSPVVEPIALGRHLRIATAWGNHAPVCKHLRDNRRFILVFVTINKPIVNCNLRTSRHFRERRYKE